MGKIRQCQKQGCLYWYIDVFDPFWANEVCVSDSSINYRTLFEFTQLTWVNQIVWDQMKLNSFTDKSLNEFADHVEEDNESERFRRVVQLFVGFRYNNGSWCFEIWWLIA